MAKRSNSFWITAKDNDNKTFDTRGPIYNDEPYILMIVDAQKNGHEITCTTADYDAYQNERQICVEMEGYGFKRDTNLFEKVNLMGMKGQETIIDNRA